MTERRARPSWRADLRPILPLAVLWLLGSAFLLALVRQQAIPYEDLLLDPAQYDGRPWYTGLISYLGVLGWTVATVAAAGGGWVAGLGGRTGAGELLRGGALLSGLLLLDDLFQFHIIVPKTIGAPKPVFYVLYGILASAWAYSNRAEFVRTRRPLLVAAVLALTASVAIDVVGDGRSTSLLAEDSAKFLGILAWALYFVLSARDINESLVMDGRRMATSAAGAPPALLAHDSDEAAATPPTEAETLTADRPLRPVRTDRNRPLRGSVDHLTSWWRRTLVFWLPLALLSLLCYRAVIALVDT